MARKTNELTNNNPADAHSTGPSASYALLNTDGVATKRVVHAALNARRIMRIEPVAFFAAAALLGGSILSDLVQYMVPVRYTITQLFEEGLKFCGITM